MVDLVLEPFVAADFWAIWYNDASGTMELAKTDNFNFQPTPAGDRSYYVALRRKADACESVRVAMAVSQLSPSACPIQNMDTGQTYDVLQDAVNDAAEGQALGLPPRQYESVVIPRAMIFSGMPPAGETKKAEISIEGLAMNSTGDLQIKNGVYLIDGVLELTMGNVELKSDAALAIMEPVLNGDDNSAIKMPLVGQENAADFELNGAPIAAGVVRTEMFNGAGESFIPLIASDAGGQDRYFPVLMMEGPDNEVTMFDLALAGTIDQAQVQSYPGLATEEETSIQNLAQDANQRAEKVDQVLLIKPVEEETNQINIIVSAPNEFGSPKNPIIISDRDLMIDPEILTLDNDIIVLRGQKRPQIGFNTYTTTLPLQLNPVAVNNVATANGFIPFAIVSGPLLAGPPDTDEASLDRNIQTLNGTLTSANSISVPGSPCFDPALQNAGDHYFEVVPFVAEQTDYYTFQFENTDFSGAAIGALYKGAINEAGLCESLLFVGAENELNDGSFFAGGKPLFRLLLEAGVQYYLLTASKEATQTGNYSWTIFSDNGGALTSSAISNGTVNLRGKLSSLDIDNIYFPGGGTYTLDVDGQLNSASSPGLERALLATGYASFSNCSGITIAVSDVLNANVCGDDTIERTFTVTNSGDCDEPIPPTFTQTLTIAEPLIDAVIAPTRYTFADASLGIPLNGDNEPDPSLTGYPMVISPLAIYELTGGSPNFGQTYGDTQFTPPAGVDVQTQRDWTASAFCPPVEQFQFSQLIRQIGLPIQNMTSGRFHYSLKIAVENANPGDELMLDPNKSYGAVIIDKSLELTIPTADNGTPQSAVFEGLELNIPGGGALTFKEGIAILEGTVKLTSGHIALGKLGGNVFNSLVLRADIEGGSPESAFILNELAGALGAQEIGVGINPGASIRIISGGLNIAGMNSGGIPFLPVITDVEGAPEYLPMTMSPLAGNQSDGLNIGFLGSQNTLIARPAFGPGFDPVEEEAARNLAIETQENRAKLDNILLLDPADDGVAKLGFSISVAKSVLTIEEGTLDSWHDFKRVYPGILENDQLIGENGLEGNPAYQTASFEIDAFSPFILTDCPDPNPIYAACNDLVNISLLDNCEAIITANMVLDGDLGCGYDALDYTVTVVYPDGSSTEGYVDRPGRFIYEIEGPMGFNCWGEINVEDKTAPAWEEGFLTELHTVRKTYDVQVLNGELAPRGTGSELNFSNHSCFQDEGGQPDDCTEPYDLIEFEVDEDDIYTFEIYEPNSNDVPDVFLGDDELILALYQGAFSATEPCSNILAQSNVVREYGLVIDEEAPDGRFRISLPLRADTKYTLLIGQDNCDDNNGEEYRLFAFSDGEGKIKPGAGFSTPEALDVALPLYCSDVEYILDDAAYTINPAPTDNCDPAPETWFEDVLTEAGDCGEMYITRTWYIRDAAGNEGEACVQTIHFKRPGLEDIQKPPTTVAIECDELSEDQLDENGHPIPEVSGYPFVITAFGIKDLNEAFCNAGADYQDISVIEVCASTHKIIRQWTILDWCDVGGQIELNNGTEVNWRQIIKVGDFSAPIIEPVANINMYAGPFDCSGAMSIPPIEVTDNCSEYVIFATIYEVIEEAEVDQYGRETGNVLYRDELYFEGTVGSLVSGLKVGTDYKLYYEVEDVCGNAAVTEAIAIVMEDKIAPVAVCVDDLTLSIGGEGISRISAADVDEGSWDNCELADILISRKLADDVHRDAWLAQVESLSFADLVKTDDEDPSKDGAEQWVLEFEGEPDQVILRRKDGMWYTAWRFEQFFMCDDIGNAITVEMAVFDVFGNVNICWMEVDIEDKVAPQCIAPTEVVLDCTDDILPYGFDPNDDAQLDAIFGTPTSVDNCPGDTAYQVRTRINWECKSGTIERWFEARDKGGLLSNNNCYQKITINPVHEYEIKFPADADAECDLATPDTILVNEIGCDLLAINVYDERFDVTEGDACYKIQRTYKVINWCEYDGEAPPVIIGRNEDCDSEVGEEDVYVLRRPNLTYVDRDNNENENPETSPCGNGAEGHLTNSLVENRLISTGYWQYTQFLKVYDRTAPVLTLTNPDPFCADNVFIRCSGDAVIPFSVSEECDATGLEIQVWFDENGDGIFDYEVTTAVLTGSYPDFEVRGNYAIGNYGFEIRVADGCNNRTTQAVPFEIVDCKPPSPICISGLAIELMPQEADFDADGDGDFDAGAMDIWATDFEVSMELDCTPELTYSINRVGEKPDINKSNLVLTCDDPDTVLVEIHLWDSAYNPYAEQPDGTIGGRNYDHCVTYVVVQDNMFNLCTTPPGIAIAGLISTEIDETVENVEVRLSGPENLEQLTSFDGSYSFENLEIGADYTVRPWKDNEHLNGVSTFDLVLITKHLLGVRRLDSVYKMIAADINRSGTISTLDLIQLRKMILSVDMEFRNNTSWRFIPRDYQFPNLENPWATPFPELKSVNDLGTSNLNIDFVAIKTGDVNGSAQPNSLIIRERNNAGIFYLETMDQQIQSGQEIRVPITAAGLREIQGYQFTLQFRDLELSKVEYGLLQEEHFGLKRVKDGVLTISWNSESSVPDQELATLVFRARTNAQLSDLVNINSRYTVAEAYNQLDETLDVALRFTDLEDLSKLPELYQNTPNPFDGETVIGFYLPEAAQASLIIRDVAGRNIRLIRGDYPRGYSQLKLNSEDLPSSGVFYYSLETSDFILTKKMVIIGE